MRDILLEACVDSLEGAVAAEDGGAGRVELCRSFEVGGLTPPAELVRACVDRLTLPVFVLVRARAGSFVLSNAELSLLLGEIRKVIDLGASGIVAGALTSAGLIDSSATTAIVAAAAPLPVTFHRAFDEVTDQPAGLEVLIRSGVTRVLTSGGARTAMGGAARLGRLVEQSADRIGILAGGTVRADNVGALVRETGVREVHSRTPESAAGVRALVRAANVD